MTTVTAPVWLLGVLGGLMVCGFVAVCWVLAGWAERAADWLRARRTTRHFARIDDEPAPCGLCGSIEPCEHDEESPPLPPERTWEQMTSHQLPLGELVAAAAVYEDLTRPMGPLEREMWHDVQRERRAPWWEAEQRQAYEALDLEFPSGLMARVREAAQ